MFRHFSTECKNCRSPMLIYVEISRWEVIKSKFKKGMKIDLGEHFCHRGEIKGPIKVSCENAYRFDITVESNCYDKK